MEPLVIEQMDGNLNFPGVYCIYNKVDGKKYIGSSKNVGKRISDHLSRLRNNKHANIYLQRAWNKYGESSFGILFLEDVIHFSFTTYVEQIYIDIFQSFHRKLGYNINPRADKAYRSEETKEKIRVARKRQIITEEAKKKMSLARKGKKFSREHVENLRKSVIERVGVPKEKFDLAIDLYFNTKKSMPKICKEVGISDASVYTEMKRRGITERRRPENADIWKRRKQK